MGDVERAGLLKMDFLGLRNLTILAKSIELVERSRGERIDPYKFPLDDIATFALLCRGETKGIFQLESGGIRDLLQRMKPDHFGDIIATNALYRPGPLEGGMVDDYIEVKHGRKPAVYPHPVMKEVLETTHGVMVFQEQVMRILNLLGGIDLADAYSCIKAISKKKLRDRQVSRGVHRRLQRGLDRKSRDIQHDRNSPATFNRSHSTAPLGSPIRPRNRTRRVHGGAVVGRYSGAQFQEQGSARGASRRLRADGRRGRAAGREPSELTSQWSMARSFWLSASRPRQRRGRRSSQPASKVARSTACSTSASGSIRRPATGPPSKRS
jgi:hypothetical protein